MGLRDGPESEQHKSVARRVFHNHDVTAANATHVSRKANIQQQHTDETLETAKAVAQGF